MTTPAPGLIEAASAAETIINSRIHFPDQHENDDKDRRASAALLNALCALPPDAVIVPRSLLTEAADEIDYLRALMHGDPFRVESLLLFEDRLRQAAATKGAQT